MSAPPITLWRKELTLPLRFAVCPLPTGSIGSPQSLSPQKDKIHEDAWELELTGGALYIMSEIAGRRTPESIRWVLHDSLREVLDGNLQNYYAERTGLLTGTFGELLGPLLLACYLDREHFDIIRLLEVPGIKTPDFLMLEEKQNEAYVHVLECKGTTDDFHAIQSRTETTICADIRSSARSAMEQLRAFTVSSANPGGRVSLKSVTGLPGKPFAIRRHASSENISVVHVTDGRIPLYLPANTTAAPDKNHCGLKSITCIDCMNPPAAVSSHLAGACIAVLHHALTEPETLSQTLQQFLHGYKQANLGIWARNEDVFESGIRQQLASTNESEGELQYTLAIMAASTVYIAGSVGLSLRQSAELLPELSNLIPDFAREIFPRLESLVELSPSMPESISADELLGRLRDRDFEPGTRIKLAGVIPESNLPYSATVKTLDEAASVRVITDTRFEYTEEKVQKLLTGWVQVLRNDKVPLDWRDEYVRLRQLRLEGRETEFRLGTTWDQYPYPHSRLNRPGISAWTARSGQAELIIRKEAFYS